jgi:2-methylisocitrate lyase-like PEP mutase family enzyme
VLTPFVNYYIYSSVSSMLDLLAPTRYPNHKDFNSTRPRSRAFSSKFPPTSPNSISRYFKIKKPRLKMAPKPKTPQTKTSQPKSNQHTEEDWQSEPATPAIPIVSARDGHVVAGSWKPGQTKLHEWLADSKKSIVCAGVYDGLTAHVALAQGFDCLYLCTAAINVARSGALGPAALSHEFVMDLALIIQQIDEDVPLVVEVDKSMHIEAFKVAIVRFHRAGIAAVQIEDEVPRRCSREINDAGVSSRANEAAFLGRIRAAVDERSRINSSIVIIARSNMRRACNCSQCSPRTVKLLQQARKAGADAVYLARDRDLDAREIETLTRETFKGIAYMRSVYGSTTERMRRLGVKIISYPELFTNALFSGVSPAVRGFREKGEVGPWTKVPKPENGEDLGGLRDLAMPVGKH